MKLRNGIYFLLLLIACKDGGELVFGNDTGSLAWSFNQALSMNSFSSGSGTNFLSGTDRAQFTLTTPTTSFFIVPNSADCIPKPSAVRINNSNFQFEPTQCGVTKITYLSGENVLITRDFYFITALRKYDLEVEYISILIEGEFPIAGTFDLNLISNINSRIYFDYSIYSVDFGGKLRQTNDYFPIGGSLKVDVSSGVFASSNFLRLRSYEDRNDFLEMKFVLGCCSK